MNIVDKAKYAEIGRRMRAVPLEKHYCSYEWEELVQKMCASNDSDLHDLGIKEQIELKRICH